MKNKSKILILIVLSTISIMSAEAQSGESVLTLKECRARAIASNKGLKQAGERKEETEALKNVALWQMLPKLSANATYMWMDRSVELLSKEQKDELQHIGTNIGTGISQALSEELGGLPIGGNLIAQALSNALANSNFLSSVNGFGSRLVKAMETDSRNIMAGVVTLTQPVYMGGKLRALYKTASLMAELSGIEYDKKVEEMMIGVDEAYWQVVSVKHKKELAEQYAALLDTLTHNVEEMVAAEVATKGDLAKVKVKFNEAQMSLTKATNGLVLAKMLLAQRCGMPLDTVFDVETSMSSPTLLANDRIEMDSVWTNRKEMRMLRISDSVAQQAETMARSTLLPNVALTAGYLVSNPNLFDGFQKEFGGTLMAGVVVNIPILHPGGFYSLKAAKAKRAAVRWQMEEAREMIELQVNKVKFELDLAYKKLAQAESNLENAEENLKLADESFKAGVASSSDLIAAQTAWVQAKGDVLDAEIEIEMGKVYLNQALGK